MLIEYIRSYLPLLEAVPPSATRGCAMVWQLGNRPDMVKYTVTRSGSKHVSMDTLDSPVVPDANNGRLLHRTSGAFYWAIQVLYREDATRDT
jgi:hypothetical protein